ncbi:MAG: type VI secretion system contractile sheath large subunit [Planctomycetota bacterium]
MTQAVEASPLLDDIIAKTAEDEAQRDGVKGAVATVVDSWLSEIQAAAESGGKVRDKGVADKVRLAIRRIDEQLSSQLAAVMHDEGLQRLEGTWRGLGHICFNSETGENLKIKALHCSKGELHRDLTKATDVDQSQMFKKIHEEEFGIAGGMPFGALVGDYYFNADTEDMEILQGIAGVAAASFCPFLTAPDPKLFKLDSFGDLSKPAELASTFEAPSYAKWRSFRESEDSRFVVMTMPRVLARTPYGTNGRKIEEFDFEEGDVTHKTDGTSEVKQLGHNEYTWMNAAYVFGTQMTNAFAETGWCTSARGFANGGKVGNLPVHTFTDDEGDEAMKCPTEIAITDRRDGELSRLGFLPLCHYKNTDYAVFFGGETVRKPKKYEGPGAKDAEANDKLSCGIQHVMAISRISHYLKVAARDRIGSMMEADECETWLNEWIAGYVLADEKATPEMKARYPLAEARIDVEPGDLPGEYNAVAYLRPWLPLEQLTTSMRLVATIPERKA